MATRRTRRTRPEPVEEDGDDLLPIPGAAALEDAIDAAQDEMIPQNNRRTRELEAQMAAMLTGNPLFPYPPELRGELKPFWLQLVNSFPQDHFQASDIPLMKLYVQCAYDIERQTIVIEDEGEVVMGGRGPIANPRCKVRDGNRATLLTLATKFRNQPASRVNAENFGNRQGKAQAAAAGANVTKEDTEGLLARPGGRATRH